MSFTSSTSVTVTSSVTTIPGVTSIWNVLNIFRCVTISANVTWGANAKSVTYVTSTKSRRSKRRGTRTIRHTCCETETCAKWCKNKTKFYKCYKYLTITQGDVAIFKCVWGTECLQNGVVRHLSHSLVRRFFFGKRTRGQEWGEKISENIWKYTKRIENIRNLKINAPTARGRAEAPGSKMLVESARVDMLAW